MAGGLVPLIVGMGKGSLIPSIMSGLGFGLGYGGGVVSGYNIGQKYWSPQQFQKRYENPFSHFVGAYNVNLPIPKTPLISRYNPSFNISTSDRPTSGVGYGQMNKQKRFFSRKFNRWFPSYQDFQRYNNSRRGGYY
jgi:hypothetical protein